MSSPTATPLRRLEAEFVRPHRRAVLLALAGMLLQSALLLPVPLAQGWASTGSPGPATARRP